MGRVTINPKTTNMKIDKVWAALNSYGIYTEEQLAEEVSKMKGINISCMAGEIHWPDGKVPECFTKEPEYPLSIVYQDAK